MSERRSGVSNAHQTRTDRWAPGGGPVRERPRGLSSDAMTERGLPGAEGTPACPFVAFADEREERSDRPDHRHRCFAEEPPAPRAAAHQEAYCLSSAFPVCPTFQDWARREAAQARASSAPPPVGPPPVAPPPVEPAPVPAPSTDPAPEATPSELDEDQPHRNPPRDWAAPPPWAGSPASRSSGAPTPPEPIAPTFLAPRAEGQGLAGSPADRLAGGGTPDPSLAALVGGAAVVDAADHGAEAEAGAAYPPTTPGGRRPSVSSTRPTGTAAKPPPPRREHVQGPDGPSWERQRRYEAYPTIKTRTGISLPAIPRIGVLALALAGAALILFFLPALLGVGEGDDEASPSPSRTPATSTSPPSPTPIPQPTPQVYVIQSGDTLSGIAAQFGITLEELLAANEEAIPDPDLIAIGDEIIIPAQPPDEVESGGGSAAPEDSPAP